MTEEAFRIPTVSVRVPYDFVHKTCAEFFAAQDTMPVEVLQKSFEVAIKDSGMDNAQIAQFKEQQELELHKAMVREAISRMYQGKLAMVFAPDRDSMRIARVLIDHCMLAFDAQQNAIASVIMPDEETAQKFRNLLAETN
ncbi:hypothetical protein [Rhizobium mongolense]|uniref:Protein required for attachment to host cells n=2 Tax=Rhizobium mongolense TaxID=57676 RepID=A0ABR6IQ76_9HYPH|nr:hypothetical protein [Rhizobium mongolense]MBB4230048.1 hypothetical protein [Rhizobium mongolense]TVZ72820.1 hypothetical protein BCL32_1007 [Rhizobium mongolense USDA 1844]